MKTVNFNLNKAILCALFLLNTVNFIFSQDKQVSENFDSINLKKSCIKNDLTVYDLKNNQAESVFTEMQIQLSDLTTNFKVENFQTKFQSTYWNRLIQKFDLVNNTSVFEDIIFKNNTTLIPSMSNEDLYKLNNLLIEINLLINQKNFYYENEY
jgi:hypothetical protein